MARDRTPREVVPFARPEGWPVSSKPMRIALVGWATLSQQARQGSGYNLSASELAAGLAMSGHEVSYLRSGLDYSLRPGIRIEEDERWRGVRCYTLINSPVPSPAFVSMRAPRTETSCPELAAAVADWMRSIDAAVLHAHSLEGYSFDLVQRVRDDGRAVVLTLHNYWMVCSQVDLFRNEQRICADYEGGRACETCMDAPEPGRVRRNRAVQASTHRALGPRAHRLLRAANDTAKRLLARATPTGGTAKNHALDHVQADPEAKLGWGTGDGDHPGTIDFGFGQHPDEKPPEFPPLPADENERFLANRDVHLEVLNDYGTRRQAGIAALNAASAVIPPSEFLTEVHRAMGLRPEHSRRVLLGQPHLDQINRATRRDPSYDSVPWTPDDPGPLRLGFLGTVRANKGFEVLAQAIEALPRDVRQRCHFHLRVGGHDWPYRKRLSRFPEVSMLGGYDPFSLVSATREYHVGIVPHVWFENSPIVLLEQLHAGRFTLAARIGGPVDWIAEPGTPEARGNEGLGNGLLFPGATPEALATAIARIVSGEVALPTPRQVHAISVLGSYPRHVAEVEWVYRASIAGEAIPAEDLGDPAAV